MRKRRQSAWTYEEKQSIIADYKGEAPIEAIAARYNFSVYQVYKFLKNANVLNTDYSAETTTTLTSNEQHNAKILYSLANGINPITGESFVDGTLDQPDVIRALYAGAIALERAEKTLNPEQKSVAPMNAGARWTKEDDEILIESYNKGESIKNLAVDFGRTEYAIIRRLEKLLEKTFDEIKNSIREPRSQSI